MLSVLLLAMPLSAAAQEPLDPVEIAARAKAATVQVRVLDERGRTHGSGSGFVISSDGMLVTSFHVVQNAHSLRIELPTGEMHTEIFYVAGDPRHDIAILKLPADGLPALRLGDDAAAEVGQRVYTMGHPLGQTATFSDGLVSARRSMEEVSLIQITAPISTGSSGGPVMNEAGEVIGIATMMLRGGQNLNFAVPVRYVRPLLATGESPRLFAASLLPRDRSGIASLGRPSAPSRPPRASPPASAPAATSPPAESARTASADPWEAQVLRQIEHIDSALTAGGVAQRSHSVETGALRNGESETISIELRGGTPYAVVGVCDQDCFDVDLRLYTPDGSLLERDIRVSDMPYVMFQPQSNGTYRLRVTMSGCGASPCRYAVASFVIQ